MHDLLERIGALSAEKRARLAEQNPLSFAQQRLWFIDQLAPGGSAYNVPTALRLEGNLDIVALHSSLRAIQERHDTLRTVFPAFDGRPMQVALPEADIAMPVVDLSDYPLPQREIEVRRLATQEVEAPFDLANGPLFRARLIRLGPAEHVLLMTMHHIISDGWSVGVLNHELGALYAAFASGKPSPLPELDIQYADFAQWQREWMQGDVFTRQMDFWRSRLEDAPALELPTDRPRPAIQTFQGGFYSFALPKPLTDALDALCQQHNVTLFMLLQAVFDVLLHRYTRQDDIVTGSPIANRNRPETEPLIGFFVNSLTMRADLSGNPCFLDLLAAVRAYALAAYDHQDLPFERLVEELNPDRDLSRNPLFQVIFAVQNAPMAPLDLAGLTIRPQGYEVHTTRFDLELHVWPDRAQGARCVFAYSTDLFDAATIARMAGHWQRLIDGVVSDPARCIGEYELLSDAERHQLLIEWNATRRAYPHDVSLQTLFESQAAANPAHIALITDDASITYGVLNEQANQLAHYLRSLGVGRESIVGLCLERGTVLITAVLAILKSGGAYLPLPPDYPMARISALIEDAQPCVMVTHTSLHEKWRGAFSGPVVCMDSDATSLSRMSTANPPNLNCANDLAYIMYTSGSTGTPKAACIEHGNIMRLAINSNFLDIRPEDTFLFLGPVSFDASTLELFPSLLNGAHLAVYPPETPSLESLGAFIQRHGVTIAWLTAGLFHQMASSQLAALTGIRQLMTGGDVVSPDHARHYLEAEGHGVLINGYGPTENTVFTTIFRMTDAAQIRDTVPIGYPVANTRVYLLDPYGHPAPVGVWGELHAGGDGVGRGYWNRPELTAERFVPDPFVADPHARLYKTGDLARWRADGVIEFKSRVDFQVKVRGFRIELGEIETILRQHPVIADCAVTARDEGDGDKRLAAYCVINPDAATVECADDEHAAYVDQWETLYNETFHDEPEAAGTHGGFHGWNSSYTGEPIPLVEMEEWASSITTTIQARAPKRILEIGCGTGLLIQRLAPGTLRYCGTDFSASVLAQTRALIASRPELAHVTLMHRRADDVTGLENETFDAIILNSVIQYFPDMDYLARVLDAALDHLAQDGFLYVGDVRSMPLLEAYAASVEYAQAPAEMTCDVLRGMVERRVREEEELVIDPAFFHAWAAKRDRIHRVHIAPKRGRYHNELTRFRYEVMLQSGSEESVAEPGQVMRWPVESWDCDQCAQWLQREHPDQAIITHIPNARLAEETKILAWLHNADCGNETAGAYRAQLTPGGVEPDQLWELGARMGYHVALDWSTPGRDGAITAVFWRGDDAMPRIAKPIEARPWRAYGNNPAQRSAARRLIPMLRGFLQERLPAYMIPNAWVILDALPLTRNGKIDRHALTAPEHDRSGVEEVYTAPRDSIEQVLTRLTGEVLHVDRVGIHDDFFSLGGHSLLATQLVSRIRETLGAEVSLRMFFEKPTPAGLAERIKAASSISVQDKVDDDVIARQEAPLEEKLLGNLENLSEEEMDRWLAQLSDGVEDTA